MKYVERTVMLGILFGRSKAEFKELRLLQFRPEVVAPMTQAVAEPS